MNKVAILVPTFSGHKAYYDRFIQSFLKTNMMESADVWCVLTSDEKVEDYTTYSRVIILPDQYNVVREKGIINKKKFYGLSIIADKYKYIIVLDDDTIFNRSVDLFQICREYFEKKILLGNVATDMEIIPKVKETCKAYFEDHEKKIIEKETGNLYLWFNQPAIYKTDTLKDFFSYSHILERLNEIDYYSFDYYIYMFYLVSVYGFKVLNIRKRTQYGACEILGNCKFSNKQADILKKHALQFTEYIKKQIGIDPVFIIHIDRKYKKEKMIKKVKRNVKYILKW